MTPVTLATVASSMLSATVAELATTAHPDAPDPTADPPPQHCNGDIMRTCAFKQDADLFLLHV